MNMDNAADFFRQNYMLILGFAWIISILTGFIIVAVWKSKMNTALLKTEAASYMVQGTLAFTAKRDRFLYSRVTKTAIPKPSSGSGSIAGSSGKSSGGRSGKH